MLKLLIISPVVIIIIISIVYFNKFIKFRNKIKNAWSDIDVQLNRRYNLIPNIVETVKGYTSHEMKVFKEVTESRSLAQKANTIGEQNNAEQKLTCALKGLFIMAEDYPDLLANENFMQLQNSLIDVEETLQFARRYYNAVVRDNNTAVESFPGLIFAKIFGFKAVGFFEAEGLEREVIQIKLNN